jgi:hypothetical protein
LLLQRLYNITQLQQSESVKKQKFTPLNNAAKGAVGAASNFETCIDWNERTRTEFSVRPQPTRPPNMKA